MRIVNLVVNRQTTGVLQRGFGNVLIVTNKASVPWTLINKDNLDTVESSLKNIASACLAGGIAEVYTFGMVANDYSTVLNSVVDKDFYAILVEYPNTEEDSVMNSLTTFAKINDKLVFPKIDTSSVSELIAMKNKFESDRLSIFWHSDETKFLSPYVVGKLLPRTIGTITWAYNEMTGYADDGLTATDKNDLFTDKINFVDNIGGKNITYRGFMTDGSFIDNIQSEDFLKYRITEALNALFIRVGKVPYTNGGIAQIKSAIYQVLGQAFEQGVITDTYSISAPDANEVPDNDKANRVLNNVVVTVKLTGAIEELNMELVITL